MGPIRPRQDPSPLNAIPDRGQFVSGPDQFAPGSTIGEKIAAGHRGGTGIAHAVPPMFSARTHPAAPRKGTPGVAGGTGWNKDSANVAAASRKNKATLSKLGD